MDIEIGELEKIIGKVDKLQRETSLVTRYRALPLAIRRTKLTENSRNNDM